MSSLSKFFFESLPGYFSFNDTYKDGEEKGLLERYLSAFEDETLVYKSDVESMVDLVDPAVTSDSYLTYLASFWGNPFKLTQEGDYFRALIKDINQIHKHKGTLEGFAMAFSLLGVSLVLLEQEADPTRYDDSFNYDDENNFDTECVYCAKLDVQVNDPNGVLESLRESGSPITLEDYISKAMDNLLPITISLGTLNYYGPGSSGV